MSLSARLIAEPRDVTELEEIMDEYDSLREA
jgi:hypothetical protein